MTKEKKFDCVKMVRIIRDKMYEEHKDKSTNEFVEFIKLEAQKNPLWKKLRRMKHYTTYNISHEPFTVSDKED